MDKSYWIERWESGKTGWHQNEVEAGLVAHFSKIKPTQVLVPLCGKSRDLTWLLAQGHEVVGVELSEKACREFFLENNLPLETTAIGAFTVYRGRGINIFNGDFFALGAGELSAVGAQSFGAIYDRAALIALPPELRPRYAAHIKELVAASAAPGDFYFLQIVLERTPHDISGPPFSVPAAELTTLYRDAFEITPLGREAIEMPGSGTSQTHECVYRLLRL